MATMQRAMEAAAKLKREAQEQAKLAALILQAKAAEAAMTQAATA